MNDMAPSDSSDDDSSSDGSPVPAKRPRTDTYGASSTTSQGSVLQDSDEEPSKPQQNDNYSLNFEKPARVNGNYKQRSSEDNNLRLSRSSLSENCSSPNDSYDDIRPGFNDQDSDHVEVSKRPSFGDSTESFYNKTSDFDKSYGDSFNGKYSEKSQRMMSTMGFIPGKGLGKYEHGRVEPVEASTQKGRRGLGMTPSVVGDVPKDWEWTPDESKPEAKEDVIWLPRAPDEPLLGHDLDSWLLKGPKKSTVHDEVNFVEPKVLEGVLKAKTCSIAYEPDIQFYENGVVTIFDTLEDKDLRQARFRSNPYETIGSVIFLNRAAVKMANIDALCDFVFTKPKSQSGVAMDKKEILYFADVCSGPGGFSEYVFYRRGWKAKGFGFTLKGPNDFKLSDFYAGTAETFNPYYGVKNDGNVFDPANLSSLEDYVLKQTEDKGVHFLMADGGFSVEGQENLQEVLSKQLYLCQCLAGLMLVRTGGHFVVKLFDIFTPFSVGLVYIMYRCFDKVCIHKPVTSRPANSERYLICLWKRLGTEPTAGHLFSVNSMLWKRIDGDDDVLELVPLSVIKEDTAFYEYIYKSNSMLGERQIQHLLKMAAFSNDENMREESQADMKEECLKLWKLPDQVRTQPEKLKPDNALMLMFNLMKKLPPEAHSAHAFKSGILNKPPIYIEKPTDLDKFRNVYDWHMMFLSSDKDVSDLRIFLSCGGHQLYQLESNGWRSVVDLHVVMPARTLIYGEVVKEYRGEGNNQIYSKALHILDGMMLGGVDISHLPLNERISQCNMFCTALSKPFDTHILSIICKRLYNMEDFSKVVENLEWRAMKRVKRAVTINTPDRINRQEMYHAVGSILFIKEIKEPWSAQMSKSSGHKYYFCMGKDLKPRSEYYIPEEAVVDMVRAYCGRVVWSWGGAASAILEGRPPPGAISRADMEEYIIRNITR